MLPLVLCWFGCAHQQSSTYAAVAGACTAYKQELVNQRVETGKPPSERAIGHFEGVREVCARVLNEVEHAE